MHIYGPFAELTRLQNELNRIFALLLEAGEAGVAGVSQWDPPLDIVDSDRSVRVLIEIPGVRFESLKIVVRGTLVIVTGEKSPPSAAAGIRRYHCLERAFGPFTKTFTVNDSVNTHKAFATHSGGVLTIELPKIADQRSRELEIPIRCGTSPEEAQSESAPSDGAPEDETPRPIRKAR